MPGPADIAKQGLEDWFTKKTAPDKLSWSDRIGGLMVGAVGKGVIKSLEDMEPELVNQAKAQIDLIRALPDLPPELKVLLDKAVEPKSFAFVPFLIGILVAMAMSTVMATFKPYLMKVSQEIDKVARSVRLPSDLVLPLWMRDPIKYASYIDDIAKLGVSDDRIELLKTLQLNTLDKRDVMVAWLRDKGKYDGLWQLVEDKALTPERIALYQELAYRLPGVQDVIRYAVKEVYSPKIHEAFGQHLEFPEEAVPDAEKTGVRRDHLMKEWISHWELPGVTQGYDMLHRKLIEPDELDKLLKARDIMPFWREKLIGLSYDLPNRIELRMMARYGLIDKSKLIEILLKGGVDPQYVDLIADMNIAVGLITDLRTRYANGYITADDIKKELQTAGLSPDIQNRLYQYIVKVEKPAKLKAGKDLAVADIIKGVNRGLMTVEEAIEYLKQLGYDEDEAYFKLAIGVTEEKEAPMPEYVKVNIDTVRRQRRKLIISHDEEVADLLGQGLTVELAMAYAINDDIRLAEKVVEE